MRALLLGMLIALPVLGAASADSSEGSGITGTWTWTYPSIALSGPLPYQAAIVQSNEPATLNLGPNGHWTVDMPSALLGCADGKPMYSPKVAQVAIVQTFPDGSCRLYYFDNGHYVPVWQMGRAADPLQAGPFRGNGDFR